MTARLHILSLSIHGLLRARDIELGRDADTGGQILYVIDQAAALARQPDVAHVEVITRQIHSHTYDAGYAEPRESIAEGATIVRIPCGPRRYLRKESLWPYLDGMVDNIIHHIRASGAVPDIIHAHYADAGYVGSRIARVLGVPLVFTGHSLGRVKRARLLKGGADPEAIERTYHLTPRIEAEERALENTALVVTSTQQEVEEQYQIYDHYEPARMEVIPPGVDLSRFRPPRPSDPRPALMDVLDRFLREPTKPMVLTVARADERKNLASLVHAFGTHPALREQANLVILAGTRDDIADQPPGPRSVLQELLLLVDRYDLYGSVAYPKSHDPDDVPALYRHAARLGGTFVNPALTEPFGLTIIEAAASGLPVVATQDGGPQEILSDCRNGVLVNPLDVDDIARGILHVLEDDARWHEYASNGVQGSHRRYSWPGHVRHYLDCLHEVLEGSRPGLPFTEVRPAHITGVDRMLVTDIDHVLDEDAEARAQVLAALEAAHDRVGLTIATGRTAADALAYLAELGLPRPDVLIGAVGTEIHYGESLSRDRSWLRHIDYRWEPERVRAVLSDVPGLTLQDEVHQTPFKTSFILDAARSPKPTDLRRLLRQEDLSAKLVISWGGFLDVIPIRASAGQALRFLSWKWSLPPERFLVIGNAGKDDEMLRGNTLGVVLAQHGPELEVHRGRPRVYFAQESGARGILEGIRHYDFLGDIRHPEEEA